MDKILFADRLRNAREAKGLTQKELAQLFNEKYGKGSIDGTGGMYGSIKKWENGTMPTLDRISNLCELLDCDLDYLTGKIKELKREDADIAKVTGLTPANIHKLKHWQLLKPQKIEVLNSFIGSPYFDSIIFRLTNYKDYLEQYNTLSNKLTEQNKKIHSQKPDEFDNLRVYNYPGETEIDSNIAETEKQLDITEFKISKWFNICIEELRKQWSGNKKQNVN